MGIAEDLLKLASHLANPSNEHSEQAWLRRAVLTAYYAFFHLLVQEAAQQWSGSEAARLGLQRTFKHDQMKDVSRKIWVDSWTGWSTPSLSVPPELRTVAGLFIGLQEARHQADYNNQKNWTKTEVASNLSNAQTAFQKWKQISGSEVANEYLLSLLVGRKRE